MNVLTRIKVENGVVSRIVDSALSSGYNVSVYDGEDFPIRNSRIKKDIMRHIMSTDSDVLKIHTVSGETIGNIYLVYGNCGWDVIADHTDNEIIHAILEAATAYSLKMEEKYG